MVHILIVYAHQLSHESFNGALKDAAVQQLEKDGHTVVVSDLYAQMFNPLPTKKDVGINDGSKEEYFHYTVEMGKCYKNSSLPADVTTEIEKVKAADLVIFQFPLHWGSVPTILKGWIDRVFISEFAFRLPDQRFENGLLKGKKAMLSLTTAEPSSVFKTSGKISGDIDAWLWPIHWTVLRFCGFDVLEPQILFSIHDSQEKREEMLLKWKERLRNIHEEESIKFSPYFEANS